MDLNALFKMSYGMYVLTTEHEGKDNGCIIDAAMQITAEPVRIAVCVNKDHLTHEMICASKKMNLTVLSEKADLDIYRRFGYQSGREQDKFQNFADVERAKNGVLYITKGSNAFLLAAVTEIKDLGSHSMIYADVEEAEILDAEAVSATYDYYRRSIK